MSADYTDGFNAGLEAAAQLVTNNWIDQGELRPVPTGSMDCTTRGGYADAIRKLSRVPPLVTRDDEDDDCPGCSQCGPPIMVTAEEGCLR